MDICKKCKGENIIGVEYYYDSPYRYDGISEWRCQKCLTRYGRWTGKILKDEEMEPPYGKKQFVTNKPKIYNI